MRPTVGWRRLEHSSLVRCGRAWRSVIFASVRIGHMSIEVQEDAPGKLDIIHASINACRMCEPLVTNFEKPVSMNRGEPGRIVIVGQEPGKGEITSQRAFSGMSGRRLDQWLIASGCDAAAP